MIHLGASEPEGDTALGVCVGGGVCRGVGGSWGMCRGLESGLRGSAHWPPGSGSP